MRFELNDAQVKGRQLPGVLVRVSRVGGGGEVASGQTGPDGRFTTRLAPGSVRGQLSARAATCPTPARRPRSRADGQLVTVSLSRMLEATEAAARDVRIILNWGSRPDQVKDADSHLACACGAPDRHVFYRNRRHEGPGHVVELDVDDTDWGGPETITLTKPAERQLHLLGARLQRPAGRARGLRPGRARADRQRAGGRVQGLQGADAAGLAAVQGDRRWAATARPRSSASPRTRSPKGRTSRSRPSSSRPIRRRGSGCGGARLPADGARDRARDLRGPARKRRRG